MILDIKNIESIKEGDLESLPGKTLLRRFGRADDSIELSIFDEDRRLLINDEQFNEYTPYISPQDNLTDSIDIDYEEVLRNYGYTTGKYRLLFSFQRKLLLKGFRKNFFISEISPSRTEIRINSNALSTESFLDAATQLVTLVNGSPYIKDINLGFTGGNSALVVNAKIDNNSCILKLYNPLSRQISRNSTFRVYEEIINPLEVNIDLGQGDAIIEGIPLRGPNFEIDFTSKYTVPSEFRTYDQILQNGAISSSFNNIQNIISGGSVPVDLEFDNPDTPSGYTFENFIHFSSATERLKNFKYKLGLLENYSASLAELGEISGSVSASSFVKSEKTILNDKTNKIVQGFDYYEKYLYFESGTYAWPKTTTGKPYTNAKIDSTAATSWFGAPVDEYESAFYGGQMLSASKFDDCNPYNLVKSIPPDIQNNSQNEAYVLFVEMIAQHFDGIWAYIDSITDKYQAHSGLNDGISKELVFNALTEKGIRAYSQFENSNIFEYFLGDDGQGSFQYTSTDGSTMISASNGGSIPKGDISKEIWKRLYHNVPHLLKTKGTERGLKALIATYGIPETVLHVKEYGGPLQDKTGFRTFSYQKESRMVSNVGTSAADGVVKVGDGFIEGDYTGKTYQIRFLPDQDNDSFPVQSILSIAGHSGDDLGILISQSIDNTKVNSGSFAHLVLVTGSSSQNIQTGDVVKVSSSLVPFFNGKPWNISLTIDSGSTNTIKAFATQTTFNKNTYLASCSLDGESFLDGINPTDAVPSIFFLPVSNAIGFNAAANNGITSSIQEARIYKELLTESTIVTQSLSPFNYNGNTISSSFEDLVLRIPLGSDLFTTASGINYFDNNAPNPANRALINTVQSAIKPGVTVFLEETHHLTTPDTVGSGMVSDKIRIDNGTFDDNFLDPFISVETSPQDRQPLDYSDVGVFFSPTFEINEDIIYTLGGFRLDDYIGDPTYYTSGSYPALKDIKDIYFQKVENKFNFADYIRTIQFFDHTLFKMIKDFVPAKANLKTGLVIESHYLERTRVAGKRIRYEEKPEHLALYVASASLTSSVITEHTASINVTETLESASAFGIVTTTENVAQTNRKSRFYNIR